MNCPTCKKEVRASWVKCRQALPFSSEIDHGTDSMWEGIYQPLVPVFVCTSGCGCFPTSTKEELQTWVEFMVLGQRKEENK